MDTHIIKVILFIGIAFSFYLIFLLLQRRNSYFQLKLFDHPKEGFMVKNSLMPINSTFASMQIKQYVIKSAFNCAYDGTEIKKENVKNILHNEGVRFLDFEVFEVEGKAVIGYSDSFDNIIDSNNISFEEIIDTVAENAFSAKNGNDPLFLHFRINTKNQPLLSDMASVLNNTFKDKIYSSRQVKKNTKLSTLMTKVVFIIDVSPNYSAGYRSILCGRNDKKCINLKDVMHIDSNSEQLQSTSEDKIINQKEYTLNAMSGRESNVKDWQMTTPDLNNYTGTNTKFFFRLVKDYGIQIVMHQFYRGGDALNKYKQLFEKQLSAFVPLTSALSYIESQGGTED